ncbi:MAG: hypothetical protein V8T31_10810 [Lachnospiraceae bacterium]
MRLYVNGLAKQSGNHTGYLAGFLFLLIVMISGRKPVLLLRKEDGKTYSGEYVVIVNAGEENTENTGKLTFAEETIFKF